MKDLYHVLGVASTASYEILSIPFKKAMYNYDYKVWVGKGNANRKKEEGNVPEYDAKLKAKYKEVLESVSGKIYIAYNEGMCMEEYLLKKIAL